MKRCPSCGQIYTDDLIYCLQDGSELLLQQPEFQTETPTVIRPSLAASRRPYWKYIAIALAALLLMTVAGAVGAYFVWSKLAGTGGRAAVSPTPLPISTPRSNSNTAKPDVTPQNRPANTQPTPERTATPRANNSQTNTDTDFVDPGTSRITFRRGRVSETVSGRINRSRDFVLRTLAGQYLVARVNSERDCVVFSDGSAGVEFSAPAGDSRLSLRNKCPSPARFDLNVTVR